MRKFTSLICIKLENKLLDKILKICRTHLLNRQCQHQSWLQCAKGGQSKTGCVYGALLTMGCSKEYSRTILKLRLDRAPRVGTILNKLFCFRITVHHPPASSELFQLKIEGNFKSVLLLNKLL